MRDLLNYLFDYKRLSRSEAEEVLTQIAGGGYSDAEIASFITVYNMRPISLEELAGFRDALLKMALPIDLSDFRAIDLCGTGGDGKDSFNISTLTAFVVAGAGIPVAKHGNYGASSICGSSNLMEALGYKPSAGENKLRAELETAGITFLHAPLFNQAMKQVAPVRKALRMKTFFNMLGPMVNPSRPKYQMTGVYSLEVARFYNYLYQQSDVRYTIVHSLDGYDEISLTSGFKLFTNDSERLLTPSSIGMPTITAAEIASGNTQQEATAIFLNLLKGTGTPAQENVVIANATFAIATYYPQLSLDDCRAKAEESLRSGKAHQSLNRLLSLQ